MTTSTMCTTPWNDVFVSIILPCKKMDDETIKAIVDVHKVLQLNYFFFEIIVVEDGPNTKAHSTFDTKLTEVTGLRIIRLGRLHGLDIASSIGMDSSIGDYIIVFSPETDPTNLIPDIVNLLQNKKQPIYGIPHYKNKMYIFSRIHTFFKVFFKNRFLLGLQDSASLLFAFDRSMANTFTQNKKKYRSLRFFITNFYSSPFGLNYQPKSAKNRTVSFWSQIDLAIDVLSDLNRQSIIKISHLSICSAAICFLYSLFLSGSYIFINQSLPVWAILSTQTSGMFLLFFLRLSVFERNLEKKLNKYSEDEPYFILEEISNKQMVDSIIPLNVYNEKTLSDEKNH